MLAPAPPSRTRAPSAWRQSAAPAPCLCDGEPSLLLEHNRRVGAGAANGEAWNEAGKALKDYEIGELRFVVSHPWRKDKNAPRMGHPALMLSHGQRPRVQLEHHIAIIEFARRHLDPALAPLLDLFDRIRRRRNIAFYDIAIISEVEAEGAVRAAEDYQGSRGQHPNQNPEGPEGRKDTNSAQQDEVPGLAPEARENTEANT